LGGRTSHDETSETLDMLLAGYAAGTLCPPLHALIGGHLELSPRNRAFVAALESAKAGEMDRAAFRPLFDRDAALAAIFAQRETIRRQAEQPGGALLPRALRHYLQFDARDIPWRASSPGVKEFRIARDEPADVSLLWISEGCRLPVHVHEGHEVMLVLGGACTESVGRLSLGDIAVIDAELPHGPIANLESDCICFCVADAPLGLALSGGGLTRCVTRH
jgi:putative transcriptional regulator